MFLETETPLFKECRHKVLHNITLDYELQSATVHVRHNQTVLDKQEAFIFFLSGKQNRCFIHYDPDNAQSSILSAQFKSKVI